MISKVALLSLGGRSYALSLEGVLHILLTPHVWPLVRIRPGFCGVFFFGGEVVPLLDLGGLLGTSQENAPFTIAYSTGQGVVGLPADLVQKIVDCGSGALTEEETGVAGIMQENFSYCGHEFPLLAVDELLQSLPR